MCLKNGFKEEAEKYIKYHNEPDEKEYFLSILKTQN